MPRRFNTAGPCHPALHYMNLARLGPREGALVLFDVRSSAVPVEERTRLEQATTASGREVLVLRA